MVHIVHPEDRWLYTTYLEQMYRQRYRVAVEHYGWKLPNAENGYDKDQFDTDRTIYLLAIDETSKALIGSMRLNPTLEPHMMSEVFSDLCTFQGVPRSENIWEGSRLILDKTACPKEQFHHARIRLSAAMNEICLQMNISHVTWMTHKLLYTMALKRWPTKPLGTPTYFEDDDATYIAAISEMTEGALQGLRDSLPEGDRVSVTVAPLDLIRKVA
ncbi:MAG: acyl-homoserine-lactone synthase [Pseudomonadota bacterium]